MDDTVVLIVGSLTTIGLGLLFKASLFEILNGILYLVIILLLKMDKNFRKGFMSTF